ncbi:MAG TPA: glycosyltransferase family 4 protein [Microvirga sp.]|jgi:glycosyltransferase involved in cell wall biosynthesis|nr:glycosyltransferase family 4 protein [Microvirga sp.]
MSLTILSVAYPLAPVGPDAVGGAEQVLSQIDAALVARGHRSIVVACEGSAAAGTLVPVPLPREPYDEAAKAGAHARHRSAVAAVLAREPVDVVHLHGIDFHAYLPAPGVPVLATLHLPPSWYPEEALRPGRPDTWFHAVSEAQHRDCPPGPHLLPPIENGVTLGAARHAKRDFALTLGRICPEKGVHLAVEAAKRAGIPLLVAGEVFPYEAHRRYFAEEVAPRLDGLRRFIGPVGLRRKRRLLSAARCLLVPSLAAETSSLVAREAIACGTPVIAFPNGALPETVEHRRTGFLVPDVEAMASAIRDAARLDPETCRAVGRDRFSLERMVEGYLSVYRRLAGRARDPLEGAA